MSFEIDTFVMTVMILVMFILCLLILTTRQNKIIKITGEVVPAVIPSITHIPGREINNDINFGTMDNNNKQDKSLTNEEAVVVGDIKIENFGNIFTIDSRDPTIR